MNSFQLIDKLYISHRLIHDEYLQILNTYDEKLKEYLFSLARENAIKYFDHKIYIRGLIEFTNYCRNDCYYCGLRKDNLHVFRYRLSKDEILECCDIGYQIGFRTFVLQGGEDMYFDDDKMVDIIKSIKGKYPDCAITLSLGERKYEGYKRMYDAGADRYLLRHETASEEHYYKIHPHSMSFNNRIKCLNELKSIGYQVGTGFMVGSPYQTNNNLASDLIFIQQFQPHMVGIGPFLPHKDTDFRNSAKGSEEKTLICISLLRLMIPNLLIPATTALGTIDSTGREKGILAGANVIMPNLSPTSHRKDYSIYDNKIGYEEGPGQIDNLKDKLAKIGYEITVSRGDFQPQVNTH